MTKDQDIIGRGDVRGGKLYQLFYEHLPTFRSKSQDATLNIRGEGGLAEALEISDKAIYAWFERGFVPPKRMEDLIYLTGSTLTFEILVKYTA